MPTRPCSRPLHHIPVMFERLCLKYQQLKQRGIQVAGKFELYKDNAGEFRFRLKAGNGENILASEGYTQKASATNGIESVKKNAPNDAAYERKDASNGKFMFNLKATNSQVIGTSQMYASAASRDNGIESVKKNAPDAAVDDQTDR